MANQRTERAQDLLVWYFRQAIPDLNSESELEIRDIVDSIVDAAVVEARAERAVREGADNG